MTQEQRLDRVERILETVATITERHSTAIDRLEAQIAQTSTEFDRKYNLLLDEAITTNDRINRLTEKVDRLTTTVDQLATTAASDRIEFREEVLRIWQYLSDRHTGNGSGS